MQVRETTLLSSEKITTLADVKNKLPSRSIVLVGGCFDIFHFGHLVFLDLAKRQGDFLVVILESDEFINHYKQKTPVHTQSQRALIVASLMQVDLVVLLPHLKTYEEYLEVVQTIKPKVIATSEGDENITLKRSQAEHVGALVKEVTSTIQPFSSTAIRKLYETFPGN